MIQNISSPSWRMIIAPLLLNRQVAVLFYGSEHFKLYSDWVIRLMGGQAGCSFTNSVAIHVVVLRWALLLSIIEI